MAKYEMSGFTISSRSTEKFASLFAGRTDAWGALHGQAIKSPVTLEHYRRHLQGRVSLGIYPLLPDGRTRWLGIDIDQNDSGLGLSVIDALGGLGVKVGVYLERSKGKGFHVLVLFSDWVLAQDVRPLAKEALRLAGLPAATEIFPKRDRLTAGTPWGNYLNLPYFGADHPEGRRMVLDPVTLAPIPLLSWLDEVSTLPVAELPKVPASTNASTSTDHKPRELKTSLSSVHGTGTRRPTLVSLAGHLRARGIAEDIAVELLVPWAREHFQPPLADGEIEKHVRGIYRRYGINSKRFPRRRPQLPTVEVGS